MSQDLINFIKKNTLEHSKEIVFFGGSFNPWHQGHLACCELFRKHSPSPLIILPDANPQKKFNSDYVDLKTITEQTRNLNNTYLSDCFYQLSKANPTYYWIKELSEVLPSISLSLLMGMDSYHGLDSWIESEKLLELISHLYVANREVDKSDIKKAGSNSRPNITFLGGHHHERLSSTSIRNTSS